AATISLELATAGSRDNDELRPSAIKTKQWPKPAAHCHLCDNSNPGCRRAGGRGAPCPCAVVLSRAGKSKRSRIRATDSVAGQNRRVTRRRGSENASAIFIPLF